MEHRTSRIQRISHFVRVFVHGLGIEIKEFHPDSQGLQWHAYLKMLLYHNEARELLSKYLLEKIVSIFHRDMQEEESFLMT